MSLRLKVPEHKQPGQGVYSDKDFADDAVTDRLETRGVFRNNAKLCFFREKPGLYGVWRRVSALESPTASLHVHAFDRAWTVTSRGLPFAIRRKYLTAALR